MIALENMLIIVILPLLLGVSQDTDMLPVGFDKSVEVNGMSFEWRLTPENLIGRLSAPAEGWVAVGFNITAGLANTNLIMAAIRGEDTKLSDRFIVEAGDHRSIDAMGGASAIRLIDSSQKPGYTEVTFSIKRDPGDQWHHQLNEAAAYHLLLAYSNDDDFQHHSIMRTHVTIQL